MLPRQTAVLDQRVNGNKNYNKKVFFLGDFLAGVLCGFKRNFVFSEKFSKICKKMSNLDHFINENVSNLSHMDGITITLCWHFFPTLRALLAHLC